MNVKCIGAQGGGNGLGDTRLVGLALTLQGELAHSVHGDGAAGRHLAADRHRATGINDDIARSYRVGRTKAAAAGGHVVFHLGDQLHLGSINRLITPDSNGLELFDLHHLRAGLVNRAIVVIILRLGAQVVVELDTLVIKRAPL